MNIWPFRKNYPKSLTAVQIEVIEAAHSHNDKRILAVIQKFDLVIQLEFDKWKVVPEEFRNDAKWSKWYIEGLIEIADMYRRCGKDQLLNKLMGNSDDNPIVRWQAAIKEAQEALGDKKPGLALTKIELVIVEIEKTSGTAVDSMLPICYGVRGAACQQMGNRDDAIVYTEKALELCRKVNDSEGVKIYKNNLEVIRGA